MSATARYFSVIDQAFHVAIRSPRSGVEADGDWEVGDSSGGESIGGGSAGSNGGSAGSNGGT